MEVKEVLNQELAERSLYEFTKQAWHVVEPHTPFIDNWHIGCKTEHLAAVSNKEITKLIINEPPRHTKSLVSSVMWFCWEWARAPKSRWLYSSYDLKLASRDSVRCRDVIVSPWYQRCWGDRYRLKDDQNVKCLARGTSVLMADGRQLPIEQTKAGDLVQSSDGVKVTTDRIVATRRTGVLPVLKLTLDDGTVLRLTDRHPLYCWNRWVKAGDLKVGDTVSVIGERLQGNLSWRSVVSIEDDGEVETWDIETETYHAFFANGVMSHNTWFTNNEQGYRISTASGGKGLGHGGDFIVTDDPHGGKDVNSDTQRQSVIEWWTQRMSTRGFPGKSRHVVVMQRLHEKDLSGHLLAERLGYEHLCLPTRYEPTRVFFSQADADKVKAKDPIVLTSLQRKKPSTRDPRTEEGELLWKAVFDDKSVADWSKTLGAYGTAGQLQQRPSPAKGTIFQKTMFRYFREEYREKKRAFVLTTASGDVASERWVHVDQCRFFQTIDTAQKLKKQNDFTAIGTWALTPWSDLLLWHMWHGKIAVPFQFGLLKAFRTNRSSWDEEAQRVNKWEPWPRPLLFQAIEDASSGTGLIQLGAANGMPFKPLSADTDAMERVAAIASLYASGSVYHLQGADWVTDFEDELLGFPTAAHDDMETTAAYAGYLVQHDVILRQGLGRDLFCSDEQTAREAEKGKPAIDTGRYKVNVGCGIELDVQFDD